MTTSTTPITGNESMWGAAKNTLTNDEINLINSSPLLVSELNAYQNSVNEGKAQPISFLNGPDNANTLQTVNTGSGLQIQFGANILTGSKETFVGDLSYEIGHFENFSNDQNLYNKFANLSPTDPNYHQMAGMVGTISEAESEANNYAVQQQILTNTSSQAGGPVRIILNGDNNSGGTLQSTLDQAYAEDKSNGIDAQQDLGQLTAAASNVAGTVAYGRENGAPINFYDYYSEHAADLQQYFYPSSTSPLDSSQSGIQGAQPADVTSLKFDYTPTSAIPGSATLGFGGGGGETLNFNGGHLSSATNTGASGSVVCKRLAKAVRNPART